MKADNLTVKKTKTNAKQQKISEPKLKNRTIQIASHRSFRLSKKVKKYNKPVSSGPRLFRQSLVLIKSNWRLFLGMSAVYGALNIILVRGFGSGLNVTLLKQTVQTGVFGNSGSIFTGATLFGYLISSIGSATSQVGGVYESVLLILFSMALIWALRAIIAKKSVGVKDAFYNSTYPFIQFILVLIVVGLQLLPLIFGGWLYANIVTYGIAVNSFEKVSTTVIALSLLLLSLYMICSSIFAVFIVTLPDMTPMKALRSARKIAVNRRAMIMRKIIFLPFGLLIIAALIMIPVLIFLTPLAEVLFLLLTIVLPVIVNTYIYLLYRELL